MVENPPFWFWWRFLLKKTFGKQQRWLGNILMDVKISKIPEFPICGQPREIVRNFRNSIPKINVFHFIFKQDFRNFRQMENYHNRENSFSCASACS